MGIKNLLKFLLEQKDIVKNINIKEYYGKKVAVDISIILYQIVIAIRKSGSDLTNNKGEITSHILGLFNKTINFLDKGIIPIYVFDGKPPLLKKKVIDARRQIKQNAIGKLKTVMTLEEKIKYLKKSVIITHKQYDQCRELLTIMGIPYINAPEEADSELAYLCKENMVHAVLTEDMDILTFGSPKIIRNLSSNNKIPIEIDLDTTLNKLNINHEQFIELCILFGCDYCHHFNNINFDKIYNTYMHHKNIEKTIEQLSFDGYNIPKKFEYKEAKQYFIDQRHSQIIPETLKLTKPNTDQLLTLLVNKYGLTKFKLFNKINKLVINYNKFQNV